MYGRMELVEGLLHKRNGDKFEKLTIMGRTLMAQRTIKTNRTEHS
jgi:hypothetical protein